jgi:NACHT domain
MGATGLATMAYYFFDFRDTRKQDRYGLLSSLLSQLSAKSDSCSEVLFQLRSNHPAGTGKPTTRALTDCLKDMLSLPGQGQIYLVVDGLDECPDTQGTPSVREEVLELVTELVRLKLRNLHLCVASRPETGIRRTLEPLEPLQISLHDEKGQTEDIVKYIESVVHSDIWMRSWRDEDKNLAIQVLSERANGT